MIVAVDMQGDIVGINVMSHSAPPGIGYIAME